MPETKKIDAVMEIGEWDGAPMLVFKDGDKDRFPFQFQASKARKILRAIRKYGVEKFLEMLEDVAVS